MVDLQQLQSSSRDSDDIRSLTEGLAASEDADKTRADAAALSMVTEAMAAAERAVIESCAEFDAILAERSEAEEKYKAAVDLREAAEVAEVIANEKAMRSAVEAVKAKANKEATEILEAKAKEEAKIKAEAVAG